MHTRTFILHWKGGSPKTEEVSGSGNTILEALANACNNAGIGKGALAALDYWEEKCPGDNNPIIGIRIS